MLNPLRDICTYLHICIFWQTKKMLFPLGTGQDNQQKQYTHNTLIISGRQTFNQAVLLLIQSRLSTKKFKTCWLQSGCECMFLSWKYIELFCWNMVWTHLYLNFLFNVMVHILELLLLLCLPFDISKNISCHVLHGNLISCDRQWTGSF